MEHKIIIEKTVRYFTYGNSDSAENIWIVMHGYSQLPAYFIRKFHALEPSKNFIVAPEGFHRFYREGTRGRVGAAWMTKEARFDDIADNNNYLNRLFLQLSEKKAYKRRILFGFSQGGATASRWRIWGNFEATHFILWASVFAEDIPMDIGKLGMKKSANFFVVGDNDPYFKGKMDEIISSIHKLPFPMEIIHFDGMHDIDQNTLIKLEQMLS